MSYPVWCPLVRLSNFAAKNNIDANVIAKVEYFNPAGRADLTIIGKVDGIIKEDTN